ncbi:SH3 domain-containing protein [Psychroserpens sp. NJDZ02]|uniref:SH3 domain-containing protein n=1 Tax=Psychroserpens sp. NJDZ02 TaxID=2570561 RepID=UPI0010A7F2CB|nr:SH3 domain-containing protein [Psychroserpens sp. NJDZ02]QCE42974.1 SH3 domain-containing protein [Psychroserpens sp. NJDZ02]
MKKNSLKKYYLIILLLSVIVGCKDKDTSSSSNNDMETSTDSERGNDSDSGDDLDVKTSNFSESDKSLICLWPKVGLRDIAGRKGAKYLTTIYFGETVKFLGEKETASDNKDYLKVELSDGQQGWVYDYLLSENGKLAVLKNTLAIYKRPDVMEFVGNKFGRGDIVVVLNESKGDWQKVTGFQKENEGWIQNSDNFVYDELDIKLAILYNRAINEDSQSKKQKKLKLITDNPAFQQSSFIDIVQNALIGDDNDAYGEDDFSELDASISSDQLYISTDVLNARSNPNSEEDNVVFQLEKGDVCDIIEKGNFETIRDNSSNWYKINFNGNEGWVFGYFTSKK